VLDNFNPLYLWYAGATLCAISAVGFYMLHIRLGREPRFHSAMASL
jgi:hypothetical protein